MRFEPFTRPLGACAALLPLLTLAACGAGSQSTDTRQPLAAAAPPAASTAASTGTSTTAPTPPVEVVQSETAPPAEVSETIRLAPTYTPLADTGNNTPYWPVWYGTGKPVDGVGCMISGEWHKHALISIYKDGQRLGFPEGVGRQHDGCALVYEMHMHDVSGMVHMEADAPRDFKLGQFFSLWQQPLSRTNTAGLPGPVRFYIIDNGTITRYDGDPSQIRLLSRREVLIVTGTQMTTVPKYQWGTSG
jgi:hypothetical protein